MTPPRRILALESSCDETAASVVIWHGDPVRDGGGEIASNVVISQIDEHSAFGGVVPEIAARAHVKVMDQVVMAALIDANLELDEVDAIAATAGPGLNGGLLVAAMTAKAMAIALKKPFYPINHLEGHALTARLTDGVAFPYLLLLVSGGHTQILTVRGVGDYERMATTIDDALGEAFDKTAKLLGLGFPGGPAVEKAAGGGNPKRFSFPHPLKGKESLNLSLSGLKTAVRIKAQDSAPLSESDVADLCASFQATIVEILEDRVSRAMERFIETEQPVEPTLVIAGGVAANQAIRTMLERLSAERGFRLAAPPPRLCTDNAAMIGWAAAERMALGEDGDMDFIPRPRWPLDETRTIIGHGKRGAKV
ncbi:MAG: tRNA (adenosine(37)-N6)-threonylcarbamoyltransferase complex transferase subunit TsaD [Pseudomonadota bacterium]